MHHFPPVCRVHEHQPTHITVRMDTSPSLKRTTVAITNVALGHATILRIVALLDNSDREAYERSGSTESAANNAGASGGREELKAAQAEPPRPLAQCSEVAVELHDCRVTWKFQPVAAKGYKLPAALHDFLLLHEDIASLDIPRLTINLPLMADAAEHELNGDQTLPGYSTLTFEAGSDGTPSSGSGPTTPGSAASGASPRSSTKAIIAHGLALNAATVGYPGQAALPIVQLPHLSLVHVVAECVNGSGTQLQALQLDVPSFDVGLHPSHLVTAAAAWQLLEHELAHLRRDHADATTGTHLQIYNLWPTHSFCFALTHFHPSKFYSLSADAESIVTSTSTSNQDHLQPSISGSVSASRSEDQEAAAPHPGESPRPPSTGNSPRAPPSAPWQLDIALGVLGLSIVGSMPSSTCLKVEWRGVGCRLSGGAAGGSEHAASGASLAWDDLAVHVMQPKAVMDFMDSMQYPSSFMLGAEGYGSPVAPSLPHSMLRGHGPRSVRRNLSAGLGLAGAADSPQGSVGFQAPPSHFLARFSANSAVSRYFSAADSEFEDAISVSDVHEGELQFPF